jgi:hypothetical protein
MRKTAVALAIVIALVAIVVPTCRMVGCSMEMGFMSSGMGLGFLPNCGGTYVMSGAPAAVLPAGADSLTLALVAAVVAAIALFRPRVATRLVRIIDAAPPPPPEDPRGERFRV